MLAVTNSHSNGSESQSLNLGRLATATYRAARHLRWRLQVNLAIETSARVLQAERFQVDVTLIRVETSFTLA